MYTIIPFFIFLACTLREANSQAIERFNTFSYNVNEGLLQSTMADIAFDKNNFCWLSFPNGIQKFDGNNFINVPVQPGLPDDKHVQFFQCNNGDLLISHSRGISRYDITSNRFTQVYKHHPSLKMTVVFIGEDESIVYFYNETGSITGISSNTFKVATESKTNFPSYAANSENRPKFSDNIIDHKVALVINSSICLWDLEKGTLISRSVPVPDISNYFLRLRSASEVLYFDYKINNALQVWNFESGVSQKLYVKGKDNMGISRCIIYPWHNKLLISFSSRLFEIDTSLQVLMSELVNFQNQPVSGNLGIAQIKEDNFGNLYLQTVTGGIKKLIRNNYPVKYYGTEKPETNFTLSVLPDKKNNRILISNNGLLVFDTLQRLITHIKTLPGETHSFIANSILKDKKGNYLLFISGEKSVWRLSSDLSALTAIPFSVNPAADNGAIQFFGNILFRNDEEAIIQSQQNIYKFSFESNMISGCRFSREYVLSGLWYNGMIISHGNDELIFLSGQTFREQKRIPFKNTGGVRCFTKDTFGNIYMGSNKGIFKIDSTGKLIYHWNKENGLPDECVYSIVFDNDGIIWCSSNKGIFRINKNNSILQLTKQDGLQENEFNTNVVVKSEDGELFFGGVNGVSSFYPAAISGFDEKVNMLFTRIKVNNEDAFRDTGVWNIGHIDLPYNRNSLSFDFVGMGINNPGQYIYQYKMKGIDKEWIQNSDLQTVRYFLQPGGYVFQVYASRFFDKDAKPLKEIVINIRPPFWKTWWFLVGLAGLLLLGMAYSINQYNKQKYHKRLAELESEHKVQTERERISRDLHDSIGAYANAVLYNTELLEKEEKEKMREELMKDLKFASKDIITALRETIWALKKDNYSAEDCLLRIRNFIQPFTRYYQHIHFRVEGDAPVKKELHYTKALNLVRIVQEAVTNAIKHAVPGSIQISSREMDNKWELTVTDDGKGFDYETIKGAEQGNGLNNMKQRAADSGFDLSITSGNARGTKISIRV